MNKYRLAETIATACGIGKRVRAPGTVGSLIGGGLGILIGWMIPEFLGFHFFYAMAMLIIFCIILTYVGVWAIEIYIQKNKEHDPQEIIVDEIVGQILVLIFGPLLYLKGSFLMSSFFLAFVLFRFFDIIKPSFIGWCDENIKNAWGVMIDDIAAAIASIITYYALLYLAQCFNLNFLMYFFL